MSALLEVGGLTLVLGGQRILDGVDLCVREGEMQVLLGVNGAGKSSLAFSLMGCAGYRPGSGTLRFAGADIADVPLHERARRGLALAWQEPARFEGLRVGDYLALGARAAPAQCLERVGLAPADYLPRPLDKTLSGGERKRIELAGVLALCPRLAILDEPTAGIDFLSLGEMAEVIALLRGQGAVLLITHQEALAAGADTATWLCAGRVRARGTPAAVIAGFKSRTCGRCGVEGCGND